MILEPKWLSPEEASEDGAGVYNNNNNNNSNNNKEKIDNRKQSCR